MTGLPATPPERRRLALERARTHRARRAADERHRAMRYAVGVGAALGLMSGAWLGQLFWSEAFVLPVLIAVAGLLVGGAAGAALVVHRQLRAERAAARRRAVAQDEERRARREAARAQRRSATRRAVPAAVPGPGADEDVLVPPGFYPDPRGEAPARYWDGATWTDEVAAAEAVAPTAV